MVIFHGYVRLPEGTPLKHGGFPYPATEDTIQGDDVLHAASVQAQLVQDQGHTSNVETVLGGASVDLHFENRLGQWLLKSKNPRRMEV